ncbi:prepilin-type N-terminal cleavage/methylation domain-containing protein [Neobacillus drentensis]|uniref:prepilin-type N-terminal cleavage/methylation domain-containing protein n=1 Tax=Neobacillus drentensis TaxID=220684 RepID=UPI0030005944
MVQALKLKMEEQKGFTLIELLAVIVILGIIAAIAIPAIGNVIDKSDKKATAQEGVTIINAAKLYMAEHPQTGVVTNLELDKSSGELDSQYLDHVKDDTFTVVVNRATTAGTFTYSLKGHTANTNYNQATLSEQQLINAANGKTLGSN